MSNSEVRNDRRTQLMAKILLGQLGFGLLITFISVSLLLYGQGYRYDSNNHKIVKTGVLYLEFSPRDSKITVNSDSQWAGSSFVNNYIPGFYNVTISKDGYTPWVLKQRIEAASVNDYRNILLFKSNIVPKVLTDKDKIAAINAPVDALASNSSGQLLSNDYEIWVGEKLVTRFSSAIGRAIWYPDMSHVVYQQGDGIRIIDLNGQNDTLLAKLSSDKETQFAIGANGSELYYLDIDIYKIATLR